jgi:hypothetical protein
MDGRKYDRVFYFFGAFALISCAAWILEEAYQKIQVKRKRISLVTC